MATKDQVSEQFRQVLKRAPSQSEIDFLSKFIDEGDLQPYEIGQILQSTPEYQRSTLAQDTAQFGQVLGTQDENALARAADIAGAQAQSRFAGLGRPATSAIASQVFGQTGNVASQLAQNRQQALADFYGRGLSGARESMISGGQGAIGRGYGLRDERRQRQFDLSDYYRQQNDFNTYLNAANRRQRQQGFAKLGGGALGFALGAPLGPLGAYAGSQVGSGIGGLF